MGTWDVNVKRLIGEAPQDFVSWLVPGATFVAEESPRFEDRAIEADILYLSVIDGSRFLLHIEFQKRGDVTMAERMWEYNVLATRKFKLPVYSIVIYLERTAKVAESPYLWKLHNGQVVHYFYFEAIKLWEIATDDIKALGLKALFVLLPLTREGHRLEVVDEVIAALCKPGEKRQVELLALAQVIASLTFKHDDEREQVKRRFAMLEEIFADSWFVKELEERGMEKGLKKGLKTGMEQGLEKGLEQGLEQGMEQGLEQGREDALEQALLQFVEQRFPALLSLTRERIAVIHDPAHLQRLLLKVTLSQHEEGARASLLEAN